jgi:hypothetical protein
MLNSTATMMDPSAAGSGGVGNGRAAAQSSQTSGSEFLKFNVFLVFLFIYLVSGLVRASQFKRNRRGCRIMLTRKMFLSVAHLHRNLWPSIAFPISV